jgi:hypothetical protein
MPQWLLLIDWKGRHDEAWVGEAADAFKQAGGTIHHRQELTPSDDLPYNFAAVIEGDPDAKDTLMNTIVVDYGEVKVEELPIVTGGELQGVMAKWRGGSGDPQG